jgi:hypothetical protein
MSEKPDAESQTPSAAGTSAADSDESTAPEATPSRAPSTEKSSTETPSTETPSTGEGSPPGSATRSTSASTSGSTSGGGRGLGLLALVVALVALALATRPYWSPEPDEATALADRVQADLAQVDALGEGLDRTNARLDELAGRMEPAQAALRRELGQQVDEEIAGLRQALDELRASLERDPDELEALARRVGRLEGTQSSGEASLEARMGALEQRIEQRVAALQDQLGGLGADLEAAAEERARRLALVHAQALLIQGRDDWMLAADADSARAAWMRAAQRIEALEAPPADLSDALARLMRGAERLEGPRISERVAALERLADSTEGWPAARSSGASTSDRGRDGESAAPQDGRSGDDPDTGNWRDRVAGAFGALVTIEALEDAPPTPLEIERSRRRIAERLDAAALASARQDWSSASRLIESAVQTVRADLDPEAPAVREALDRLEDLRQAPESPALPAAYDEVMDGLAAALERGE